MNSQFWWYVARASGLVSWGLATASVLWGLFLSSRALGKRPPAPWLLAMHRYLGALTVFFVGAHIGGLVADNYVHFGLADILVPFAASWKTAAVAWGVIAFWLLLAVEVSSLLMRHMPRKWWRGIHFSAYAVFALATLHGLTAGTDAKNPASLVFALVGIVAVSFFTLYRVLGPRRSERAASRIPARRATPEGTDLTVPAQPRVTRSTPRTRPPVASSN